ncbi:MAG: hypothetical protein PHD48_04715 [Alphaproteobacteria bacterium]|nr:hypothetical protein [Alphaproteobacteria bacterium]
MKKIEITGRPLNGFRTVIKEHREAGMEILTRNARSMPTDLRRDLHLGPEHFALCGFMGHRALTNQGDLGKAIYLYTKKMGQLEDTHNVGFALLSGGGMPDPINPEQSGYMGQWVRGISESNHLGRFLSLQELVMLEGIRKGYGRAVILQNLYGEARYGERTDGLLCAADGYLTFPGGNGTLLEVGDYNVSASITPDFARRKMIYVDPFRTCPKTGRISRFMEHDAAFLRRRIEDNGMSEDSARKLNENCIRYQPALGLSADQISDELVSLCVALRQGAVRYAPQADYSPLPKAVLHKYLRPIDAKGSQLAPLFEEYPVEWDWLHDEVKSRSIRVKGRTANHEFVGRTVRPTRNGGDRAVFD